MLVKTKDFDVIRNHAIRSNKIIILGFPESGKTSLFRRLLSSKKFDKFYILETDDYYYYERLHALDSVKKMIKDLAKH